jgi:ABC-type phosphate/phosphonate transport system permease subunit
MTTPDKQPSFFARIAIVITTGIVGWQLFFVGDSSWKILRSGSAYSETSLFVGVIPPLSFLAIAGLYYVSKGKPIDHDISVATRLYRVWAISTIGGALCSFLMHVLKPDPFKF